MKQLYSNKDLFKKERKKDEQDTDQMLEAQNKHTEAGKEDSYKAAVLKVWPWDQQQQRHQGTWKKCKLSSPTPDLLNGNSGAGAQQA